MVNFTKFIKEKENLPKSKAEIFEYLIQNSIKQDQEKFKDKTEEIETILKILSKLAFVMENLCRNYLMAGEIEKIFTDIKDRDLLYCSTLWIKKDRKFKHNNYQEYLAAKEITKLDYNKIKEIITFNSEAGIIIPSWSNTISFLINLLDSNDSRLHNLFNLILNSNPDIIVKAEPGQINNKFRTKLFIELFEKSKKKILYFRVNYATHWELIRFCDTKEIVKFLIDEINKTNIYIAKLSALKLISYLNNYYTYEDTLYEKILALIYSENEDIIISTSIDIIAKSKPLTEESSP